MKTIAEQLAMKIRLERIFLKEVSRIFNSIAKDFRLKMSATGSPPYVMVYKPIWEVALKKHYQRVQMAFKGSVKAAEDDLIQSIFLDWRNLRAPKQAEIITETTRINMNESSQIAAEEAALEGLVLTARENAANSTEILRKKFKTRSQTLVNTETQSAAESAKFAEAEVLSGVEPGRRQDSDTWKRWTTVGDNHVRAIHKTANGQMRKLNEPFLVAGEYLMHPGDASLGASIGNLANCRCIVTYSFY